MIYLNLLRNRQEKLTKVSLVLLFLKLVQLNYICLDNVHVLFMSQYNLDIESKCPTMK